MFAPRVPSERFDSVITSMVYVGRRFKEGKVQEGKVVVVRRERSSHKIANYSRP